MIRNSAIRGRLSVDEEIQILLQDRREHVENIVTPALNEEKIVILDRYYFSTAAYQGYSRVQIPSRFCQATKASLLSQTCSSFWIFPRKSV